MGFLHLCKRFVFHDKIVIFTLKKKLHFWKSVAKTELVCLTLLFPLFLACISWISKRSVDKPPSHNFQEDISEFCIFNAIQSNSMHFEWLFFSLHLEALNSINIMINLLLFENAKITPPSTMIGNNNESQFNLFFKCYRILFKTLKKYPNLVI